MPEETAITGTIPDTSAVPDAPVVTGDVPPPEGGEVKAEVTNEPKAETPEGEKPSEQDAKPTVPEAYEFKMPEGISLDESAVGLVTPVLKELGVTQEGAQKLADVFMNIQAEQASRQAESWLTEGKADKEIGGAKWDASTKLAQKAFAEFASPELKSLLETTGLGNHPGLIKAFVKIAQRSAQDTHVPADANMAETNPAARLFPNTK